MGKFSFFKRELNGSNNIQNESFIHIDTTQCRGPLINSHPRFFPYAAKGILLSTFDDYLSLFFVLIITDFVIHMFKACKQEGILLGLDFSFRKNIRDNTFFEGSEIEETREKFKLLTF